MKRRAIFGFAVIFLLGLFTRPTPSQEPKDVAPKAEEPRAEEKKAEPKPALSLDVPESLDAVIERASALKVTVVRKGGYKKPYMLTVKGGSGGKAQQKSFDAVKPEFKEPAAADDVARFYLTFDEPGDRELTVEAIGQDGVKAQAKVKVKVALFKVDVSDLEIVAGKPMPLEIKVYRKKGQNADVTIFDLVTVAEQDEEQQTASAKLEKDVESAKVDLSYPKAGSYKVKVKAVGGKDESDEATITVTVKTPDPTGANTGTKAVVGFTPADLSKNKIRLLDSKAPNLEDVSKNFGAQEQAISSVNDSISSLADIVGKNRGAMNMIWTLVAGFLVMFMQTGFAMVETGLTRAKNVAHTMAMNIGIYGIGLLAGPARILGSLGHLRPRASAHSG